MIVTLNDRVTAKLSEYGRNVIIAYYASFGVDHRPEETYSGELWEAMNIFGPAMMNGGQLVFETTEFDLDPARFGIQYTSSESQS